LVFFNTYVWLMAATINQRGETVAGDRFSTRHRGHIRRIQDRGTG
jgi:hypothetical protein